MGSQQNRTDLNNQVQTDLPTNNAKSITANVHRDVLDSYSKSSFNLIDDDAGDVDFDNTGSNLAATDTESAIKELDAKNSLSVLAKGTVLVGDIRSSGAATVTGDFSSATKTEVDLSTEVVVNFTNPLANTNYIPLISYSAPATLGNQLAIAPLFLSKSTGSFTFKISETAAESQNLTAHILIVEF